MPGQGVLETEQCYAPMAPQKLRDESLLWARGQAGMGSPTHCRPYGHYTNLEAVLGPSWVSTGADRVASASLT